MLMASPPPGSSTPAPAADAAPDTTALFGKDPMPRLVDVHPLMDRSSDAPAAVRLYQRSEDLSRIAEHEARLYPFFFISDITLLRGLRNTFRFNELAGDNFFRYLVVFNTWGDYWNAVRQVERRTESPEGRSRPQELYLVGSPAQQYMMQTGRTCFLDMTLDDLHRMQLDIEVYAEGRFPNAEEPDDRIIIVALSDNRGWTDVLHLRDGIDERTLLQELVHVIREQDPDVIEGYNCFSFDFNYILTRCEMHGVAFAVGRDGSVPRTYESSMRFAERTIDYPALDIAGRHVIDAFFQVMAFDVFKRDLPDYSLKTAAKYFGFAPDDRTYIEGEAIAEAWRSDRERLLRYALDDVTETRHLARHLSGSTFYLTQMLPMTYGASARRGPAAKIESLFVREYLRQRHSIPRSEWGSQSMGGYTDIFVTGVVGPIVYADVESLYPSIMLNYDIQPSGDALDLFPNLLDQLTDLRLRTKEDMRNADEEEIKSELDARQSSYKILINCFDPETEIMTLEGAKNIREVDVGDRVYSLNPDTLQAEVKPVTEVYAQPSYRGPMVQLKNRFVDFLVTPNHRLLTNRVNGDRKTGYQWIEAQDLFRTKCRHHLPPRSALQHDASIEVVDLAVLCDRLGIAYKTDNRGRIKELRRQAKWIPRVFDGADWMAFMGWFISEGHLIAPVIKDEHRSTIDYEGSIHCLSVADNHTVLAGRNGTFNWIGQSFYGNLGFGLAAFNDVAEADRVARIGQDILRQLIAEIRNRGGEVIEVDTDGVLFVPPEDVRGEQAEIDFTRSLTEAMPEGIRVGFDGRFKQMLSYKKKNYALLTYDDTLKFKGSSLISRSNEAFGRAFVRKAIRRMLEHNIQGLHDLYIRYRDAIVAHDWQGVERFSRTETLKNTIADYEANVESGKRPRAAAYELAKQRAEETGQPVRKGDRVRYYITGDSANVTAFQHCKWADEWDPDDPDENTAYYIKRLDEFASKFEPFFTDHDFRLIFSPEDLFGFSADGIKIQRQHHEATRSDAAAEDDVPF
jgi:DNA polymerase elongation subunit (family B)